MGIQSNINQGIGVITGAIGLKKHLENQESQIEATNESNDLAQKQFDELNKPDYGKTLTNAQAERKALASLMNAQYPGSLLKNFNPETRIEKARLDNFKKLKESYELAKEKELQAGLDYNYPAGKQMVHTLTEEEEDK